MDRDIRNLGTCSVFPRCRTCTLCLEIRSQEQISSGSLVCAIVLDERAQTEVRSGAIVEIVDVTYLILAHGHERTERTERTETADRDEGAEGESPDSKGCAVKELWLQIVWVGPTPEYRNPLIKSDREVAGPGPIILSLLIVIKANARLTARVSSYCRSRVCPFRVGWPGRMARGLLARLMKQDRGIILSCPDKRNRCGQLRCNSNPIM